MFKWHLLSSNGQTFAALPCILPVKGKLFIEVLGDPIRIAVKVLELARLARFRVNSCTKNPMILTPEQNLKFLHEPLKRGIAY